MTIKYFAVLHDDGSTHIVKVNMDRAWGPTQMRGWTEQEIRGPSGRILGSGDTEEEAKQFFEKEKLKPS